MQNICEVNTYGTERLCGRQDRRRIRDLEGRENGNGAVYRAGTAARGNGYGHQAPLRNDGIYHYGIKKTTVFRALFVKQLNRPMIVIIGRFLCYALERQRPRRTTPNGV